MLLPRSHRLSRRRSRLILPVSIVSASAAASMRRHCGVCSPCWSDGDDPGSLWCAGLAGGRPNRYEARHDGRGMSLYAKRLEKGRFIWPSPVDGVLGISASQLAYMLDGIDWRNPRHTYRPEHAE